MVQLSQVVLPFATTGQPHGLNPFESTRWRVSRDGQPLGYVSRYYYDGRSHWYIWIDFGVHTGLRCEVRSRKHGIEQLEKLEA